MLDASRVVKQTFDRQPLHSRKLFPAVLSQKPTEAAAFTDTGLVFQILPNAEIDFGCNFGLTDAAPDYQPFVGFSVRF